MRSGEKRGGERSQHCLALAQRPSGSPADLSQGLSELFPGQAGFRDLLCNAHLMGCISLVVKNIPAPSFPHFGRLLCCRMPDPAQTQGAVGWLVVFQDNHVLSTGDKCFRPEGTFQLPVSSTGLSPPFIQPYQRSDPSDSLA